MFQGYTQGAIDFLWGLKLNNERPWFQEHREEFTTLVDRPTRELAEQLRDEMTGLYPKLGLELKVSRIYRDARRLFGRGPYKDHLWLSLTRPHEEGCAEPVFWFELGPEGYSYGMGFWQAPAVTMAKFRARMDREPKVMEKLARRFQKQDVFVLEGEDYKRPKAAPSRLLTPWYSKKSFALSHDAPHGEPLWSHDLVDLLLEGYEFLLPYYEYMLSLSGDPDPRAQ